MTFLLEKMLHYQLACWHYEGVGLLEVDVEHIETVTFMGPHSGDSTPFLVCKHQRQTVNKECHGHCPRESSHLT